MTDDTKKEVGLTLPQLLAQTAIDLDFVRITLEDIVTMPDSVYPTLDNKTLTEEEKTGFILGINLALDILENPYKAIKEVNENNLDEKQIN